MNIGFGISASAGLLACFACTLPGQTTLSREYIYAGPQVIAVENTVKSGSGGQAVAGFLEPNGTPALTFIQSPNFPNAGGYLVGAPAVAQDPSTGNVYVVGMDSAGGVHLNTWNFASSSWNGWQYSGGILDTTSGMTAAAVNGVVWFTGRDTGYRFWINSWNGSSFSGWVDLVDGVFVKSSVPQIAVTSNGTVWVAGVDSGGRVWSDSYVPSTQTLTGWVDRQGLIAGQPSITAGQDGYVYVAVWNSNGTVYVTQIPANNGSGPNTWISSGATTVASAPSITSANGTNYISAIASGTVYLNTFSQSSQTFGSWVSTGLALTDQTIVEQGGNIYVAGRDSNTQIWWYSQAAGTYAAAGGAGLSEYALAGAKQ
jgi:hypothetical protein